MDSDVVRGLRSRGLDVLAANEAGMIRRSDEEHLSRATADGLTQQTRYSAGEQIRRLSRLIGSTTRDTREEMRNRIEFLGRW